MVPVYARGYISARGPIPYALVASIPAFTGTLLAARRLHNPAAVHVVTTELVSTSIVSLIILWTGFSRYERVIENRLFHGVPQASSPVTGAYIPSSHANVASITGSWPYSSEVAR